MTTVLAVDLESTSGRVLTGTLHGGRLDVTDIHRFKHGTRRRENGTLTWGVATMEAETITDLKKALEQFPDAHAVSIDTWGVDWAPLDEGDKLVGDVVAYHGERASHTLNAFRDRIDDREFLDLTDNQPATINMANQLFAYLRENPADAQCVATALSLLDYFAYRLAGVADWSCTIVSTSDLFTSDGGDSDNEAFNHLGIPRGWFRNLAAGRTVIGPCTVPGLETLAVMRGGVHGSACTIHGLPIERGKRVYFPSCGSWSVLGTIEDGPLVSGAAFDLGTTNEGHTDGKVRPLFNITGTWILREIQRQRERKGTPTNIDKLVTRARELPATSGVFDPNKEAFAIPGDMQRKTDEALDAQGAACPGSMAGYVHVIIESFTHRCARAVDELTEATRKVPDQFNPVDGGACNRPLCNLIAQISGVIVVRGPVEASIFDPLLAQLEAIGTLVEEGRATVIATSAATHVHVPTRS